MTNLRFVPRAALLAGALIAIALPTIAEPVDWHEGDLFVAVGGGAYHVFDRDGRFKQALDSELGGYTTDCGFHPVADRLFTVNFTHTKVLVFADEAGHELVQTIDAGATSPDGHSGSIVFDADGHLLVGHPDGNSLVHRYRDDGALLSTFRVEADGRGANWMDLAADQRTLFYTSQGRLIHRFDTGSAVQQPAFAELPGEGFAQAIRLLPPGDGSGGLLVADGHDIKRLDGAGEVLRRYDAHGLDSWFALNLDPDGRSFWATDQEMDRLVRFDLHTGGVQHAFSAGPGNTLFGVCLKGELTAGVEGAAAARPRAYDVSQNVPNPFNPSTSITYRLPVAGQVSLAIYNLLGQRLRVLVHDQRAAGVHTALWDGLDEAGQAVSSGVYFYRFRSDGLVETHSMVLLK